MRIHEVLQYFKTKPLWYSISVITVIIYLIVTSCLYVISLTYTDIQKAIYTNVSLNSLLQLANIALSSLTLSRVAVYAVNYKAQNAKIIKLENTIRKDQEDLNAFKLLQVEVTQDTKQWVSDQYNTLENKLIRLEASVDIIHKHLKLTFRNDETKSSE